MIGSPRNNGYQLPTHRQWSIACRGDSGATWSWGDASKDAPAHAWLNRESSGAQSVGTKRPNANGLFDLHGNVWEWLEERFGGMGQNADQGKVVGGGWATPVDDATAGSPLYVAREKDHVEEPDDLGFRVLLDLSTAD